MEINRIINGENHTFKLSRDELRQAYWEVDSENIKTDFWVVLHEEYNLTVDQEAALLHDKDIYEEFLKWHDKFSSNGLGHPEIILNALDEMESQIRNKLLMPTTRLTGKLLVKNVKPGVVYLYDNKKYVVRVGRYIYVCEGVYGGFGPIFGQPLGEVVYNIIKIKDTSNLSVVDCFIDAKYCLGRKLECGFSPFGLSEYFQLRDSRELDERKCIVICESGEAEKYHGACCTVIHRAVEDDILFYEKGTCWCVKMPDGSEKYIPAKYLIEEYGA